MEDMKAMSTQMPELKRALEFFDYDAQRCAAVGAPPPQRSEEVIRRGISDLDFDPVYFLATGVTSAEGWASK
jgi:hypothetical protein